MEGGAQRRSAFVAAGALSTWRQPPVRGGWRRARGRQPGQLASTPTEEEGEPGEGTEAAWTLGLAGELVAVLLIGAPRGTRAPTTCCAVWQLHHGTNTKAPAEKTHPGSSQQLRWHLLPSSAAVSVTVVAASKLSWACSVTSALVAAASHRLGFHFTCDWHSG